MTMTNQASPKQPKVSVTTQIPVDDLKLLEELAAGTGGATVAQVCEHAIRRFLIWKLAQMAGKRQG